MVGIDEGDPVAGPGDAGPQQEGGPDVRRKPVGSGSPEQHVQRASLGREQQVEETVPVVVGGRGSPHPPGRLDAPGLRTLGERADPIVREDLHRTPVVHHQEVHVPVVVPVGEQREETAPRPAVRPGLRGDVREASVPVVSVETVRSSRKIVRNAEDLRDGVEPRERSGGVVGNLDVEVAVVIEVGERGAHRKVLSLGSRCVRPREERPGLARTVEEKGVRADPRRIDVRIPIEVHVTDRHADRPVRFESGVPPGLEAASRVAEHDHAPIAHKQDLRLAVRVQIADGDARAELGQQVRRHPGGRVVLRAQRPWRIGRRCGNRQRQVPFRGGLRITDLTRRCRLVLGAVQRYRTLLDRLCVRPELGVLEPGGDPAPGEAVLQFLKPHQLGAALLPATRPHEDVPQAEVGGLVLRLEPDGRAQGGLRLLETADRGVGGAEVVLRHRIVGVGGGDLPEGGERRLGVPFELLDETQVVARVQPAGIEIERPRERSAGGEEVALVEPGDSEVQVGGCRLGPEFHHPRELGGGVREPELLKQRHAAAHPRVRVLSLRLGADRRQDDRGRERQKPPRTGPDAPNHGLDIMTNVAPAGRGGSVCGPGPDRREAVRPRDTVPPP